MDVKQAISKAKSYLAAVFADEDVFEIRLEEVEFDSREDAWRITLGLMRPSITSKQGQIAAIMSSTPLKRTYKVVSVPNDETEFPSIKIREFAEE